MWKRMFISVAVLLASVVALAMVALVIRLASDSEEEAIVSPPPTPTSTPVPPETVSTFPDENLDAAVRQFLGKGPGEEIAMAECSGLTALFASGRGIADLSGLEYCTNLTFLLLDGNQISDIFPLVQNNGLGAGAVVLLQNNNLDLRPCSEDERNIRALLDRGVNVVHDPSSGDRIINPPGSTFRDPCLEAAIRRALGKGPEEEITAAELAELTELDVRSQNIADLTGIDHLVNLTQLSLRWNPVSDLSPLASLTNLAELDLRNNNLDLSEGSENLEVIRQLEARGVKVYR